MREDAILGAIDGSDRESNRPAVGRQLRITDSLDPKQGVNIKTRLSDGSDYGKSRQDKDAKTSIHRTDPSEVSYFY
jgi:hypothetical protein